jgi:hypothetical protein
MPASNTNHSSIGWWPHAQRQWSTQCTAVVDLVGSIIEIRRIREPVDFLGTEARRYRAARTITFIQRAKAFAAEAERIVQGAGQALRMAQECFSSLLHAKDAELMADEAYREVAYQRVVGCLLHLVHTPCSCAAGGITRGPCFGNQQGSL